ncbi:tellurite resistance TerB family protein [Nocardioides rubriscoriae]|uniref:tellurite resistance TerB family protein n=1 Tax=Nocardioides rubriscoriae TaxID=642762 RepID=UPI0011DF0273|nr:TerB family tellurite resistance protein [Nocardioides rubriscoriae]
MPIWNRLRQATQDMQTQLLAKKNELQSGSFRDASMAMCALVAAADGSVDASERQKVSGLITSNAALSNFPPDTLSSRFDESCNKLAADYQLGKVELIQVVGKTKKKPSEARAVIQIGIIIGGADGHFDDQEKAVVREACHAVGIDPAEFEL